jgi:XTP/dITP diphosphohydrolase
MEIVFASANEHKVQEVEWKLGVKLKSLSAIGCVDEIPETGATLEENARIKARYVWNTYGMSCFADDTGLEVETLDGRPGVYSARYAGPQKNAADNMALLLRELEGKSNRRARFRTVICLILEGHEHLFEGIVNGRIIEKPRGSHGFGYDPVFIPEGSETTFAEMSLDEKNIISHRGRAIQSLAAFLSAR